MLEAFDKYGTAVLCLFFGVGAAWIMFSYIPRFFRARYPAVGPGIKRAWLGIEKLARTIGGETAVSIVAILMLITGFAVLAGIWMTVWLVPQVVLFGDMDIKANVRISHGFTRIYDGVSAMGANPFWAGAAAVITIIAWLVPGSAGAWGLVDYLIRFLAIEPKQRDNTPKA